MSTSEAKPRQVRVLVVEDDHVFRERLVYSLERCGHRVVATGTAGDALGYAQRHPVDRAIVDLRLPDMGGLELVPRLLECRPTLQVLVLTGYGSIATALEAVRLGAGHYLTKPVTAEQIEDAFAQMDEGPADGNSADGNSRSGDPASGNFAGTEMDTGDVPSLARVEWEHIQRVLQDCGGNITHAAELLGIHRRSLQRKLQKLPSRR